ncbi:MAG: chromate transporter [Treponemataceae bacterium]|nr:chromate transporter [Treponemataceae bacterium]
MKKIKELLGLFGLFFKIGACTFGGGLAMLPILERELTEKRNWTTKETLLDYYAIGQTTPGIIAVNVATFIGYNRAGITGGIIATLGVVAPSILIISLIAIFLTGYAENPYVRKALAGINVAVAALLCKVVWGLRKNVKKSLFTLIMCLATFAAVVFLKVNTAIVVICGIAAGFVYHIYKTRKTIKSKDGEQK